MATHGTIAAFSNLQETWTVYIEHLQQYFAANKIEDADQQRAILLSICGPATYRLRHPQFGVAQEANRIQDCRSHRHSAEAS